MVSSSESNARTCPGCRRPDPWMMSQAEKKTFFQGKLAGLNDQTVTERFEELLADAVYDPRPLWEDWTLPRIGGMYAEDGLRAWHLKVLAVAASIQISTILLAVLVNIVTN
jgi:hypothetical protein